jgi:hypothetical protein
MGERARAEHDYSQARLFCQESVDRFRIIGDQTVIASAIGNLGRLAYEQGEDEQARAAFTESITLLRSLGIRPGIADWLLQLGRVEIRDQAWPQAEAVAAECLQLYYEINNPLGVADALALFAEIAAAKQQFERAAHLLSAGDNIRQKHSRRPSDPEMAEATQRFQRQVQASLPAAAWQRAQEEGHRLSLLQAIAYALAGIEEPK